MEWVTREIVAEKPGLFEETADETDLLPEYCHYRDEGCEFAASCLDCPYPQCLYDEPRGKQRWLKERRNREIARLFQGGGWGVKELAALFGLSQRTVQRALKNTPAVPVKPGREPADGSNAYIYYGRLHTLDAGGSTLPAQFEDLVAGGACGYAAVAWAGYAVNRVNTGGTGAAGELLEWGNRKLEQFRRELRRLGRRHRVRAISLYRPGYPGVSKDTDYGP